MQALLDQAVEELSRRRFFEDADKAYAALRKNKKAWREHRKEMEVWDAALMDGLEEE